jgi:hypothetical protein
MFGPPARLASTLLPLCWVACALNGCLVSQEDRMLSDIPAQRNRPPRIIEERLDPRDRYRLVTECIPLTFEIRAEDPDINDLLKVRWYVDYHRTQLVEKEQFLSPSGQPERTDPGSLTVDLSSRLGLPASQLQAPGTHFVEAVVFDNQIVGTLRIPLPFTAADAGVVENPSYAVSYAWVVEATRNCP